MSDGGAARERWWWWGAHASRNGPWRQTSTPVFNDENQLVFWSANCKEAPCARVSRHDPRMCVSGFLCVSFLPTHRLLAVVLPPRQPDHRTADGKRDDREHERRHEAKAVGNNVGGNPRQNRDKAVAPRCPRERLRQEGSVEPCRRPPSPAPRDSAREQVAEAQKGWHGCAPSLPCSQTSHASKTEKRSEVAMPARRRPNMSTQKLGESLVRHEIE